MKLKSNINDYLAVWQAKAKEDNEAFINEGWAVTDKVRDISLAKRVFVGKNDNVWLFLLYISGIGNVCNYFCIKHIGVGVVSKKIVQSQK